MSIFESNTRPTFIAAVRRNTKLFRKEFGFGRVRDKATALAEAQAWLAQVLTTLPPRQYEKVCRSHKRSCERVGVFRQVKRDKPEYPQLYLCFLAGWTDATGKLRMRTFQAGNVDTLTDADERHAWLTALAFREQWEHCRETNMLFDPAPYRAWRTVRCYPFVPPSAAISAPRLD